MKRYFFILLILLAFFSACKNDEWEFPNFDYSTVYFAYQSPVRTLTLGEDIYDTSLDNEHKFLIMATLGGVYENDNDITINVVVDNSLCENLTFEDAGSDVIPMPASYYSLPASMQIVIPKGKLIGGIEVQLTDQFFADSLAIGNNYVIPLVMTSVTNADSILSGSSLISNPYRLDANDWTETPKDYVLYAVKYINQWHGYYLRRGVENVVLSNGSTRNFIYRNQYVERDEVCQAITVSYNEVEISLRAQTAELEYIPFSMILSVDNSGKCTITTPQDSTSYTITGSGSFVENGDSWGDKQRNVLHLDYTVDFGSSSHSMTDTLVIRNRGVQFETFQPVIVLPSDDE